MPTVRKKIALLDGLDQYSPYCSVICVFGSVVGCVVVPLITQSIESIIFSAILISLTAKTIHSRSLNLKEEPQDDRKRGILHERRSKRKKLQSLSKVIDNDAVRRQRQEELLRLEEHRNIEREQKLEERRQKKAHKREQKLKLKEEEEKEKMREAQHKREREEKKTQRKQQKGLQRFASLESIQPVQRERKNSSSSSGSARSTRSLPRPRPPRMTPRSCFSHSSSDSNLVSPILPSPSLSPQSKLNSTQAGKRKLRWEKNNVTPSPFPPSLPHYNHSTNNNHPSPSHGQVYAVNPLAPSSSVAMATPVIPVTKTAVTTGCVWNEQLYYWSLAQAGLTEPVQYGWDPVTSPTYESQPPVGNSLRLNVQPNSFLWDSGPFSAPGTGTKSPVTTSPSSVFGAIGNSPAVGGRQPDPGPRTLSRVHSPPSNASDDGRYSLFNGSRHSLFCDTLLQQGGGDSLSSSDAGASPQHNDEAGKKFDEWPIL